ncbi:MAG TPA: Glu-tRNA(Gln) amidotransferase subunit GatE [candidate division Zixibacteria bacterium]|nr:Glu-tRNA(Gln) amidotransferase subunit GatE [candidate division Zixibacteria bacterium]
MHSVEEAQKNYEATRQKVGYIPRRETDPGVYASLGFKCGLEIHQQLLTAKKLFCRCPAGIYSHQEDFDAEVIRHMRPTLSELGEYDGTALMEFRTRKNIVYRIKSETACTYEFDDTPPFRIDREGLDIAIEIALLLKTNIVGELHITRKQYLDGSIPTGFQRTAIVGIEGEIPISNKKIGIIQISIEEDSCREVSDVGHWRTYTTDRLGMPLIEMVTYPHMLTPDEAAEAGHYLRFLARSSGKVRTGIGAARQDVNVSVTGGERVEIKGVQHIRWIPELTHNEAFRQKALLRISELLKSRIKDPAAWQSRSVELTAGDVNSSEVLRQALANGQKVAVIALPQFAGILSHFTQPGKCFANELSDRIKVIACIEKPNMIHTEALDQDWLLNGQLLKRASDLTKSGSEDALVIVWGDALDVKTAVETIDERCRLAFDGVPNETRKSLSDGTTLFERVLPGPDRMYPDTDSAPLPIHDDQIDRIREGLAEEVVVRQKQLSDWQVPHDCHEYILKSNLVPLMEQIESECELSPRFIGTLLGHTLKNYEGVFTASPDFTFNKILGLARFVRDKKLDPGIMPEMLKELYQHPNMVFDSILTTIGFKPLSSDKILAEVTTLSRKFDDIKTSKRPDARIDWIMGRLRPLALGNMPLVELHEQIQKEVGHE